MPGLDSILRPLLRMEGAVCAGVVERDSGRLLAAAGNGSPRRVSAAAVAAVARLGRALDEDPDQDCDHVEDVMITSGRLFHIMRQVELPAHEPVVIYVQLRRGHGNPAACRRELGSAAVRTAVLEACGSPRPAPSPATPPISSPGTHGPPPSPTAPATADRPAAAHPALPRPPAPVAPPGRAEPAAPGGPRSMPIGLRTSSIPATHRGTATPSQAPSSTRASPRPTEPTATAPPTARTPPPPPAPPPRNPPAPLPRPRTSPPAAAARRSSLPSPAPRRVAGRATTTPPTAPAGGPPAPQVPEVLPRRVRGARVEGEGLPAASEAPPDGGSAAGTAPSVLRLGWIHDTATLRRLLNGLRRLG